MCWKTTASLKQMVKLLNASSVPKRALTLSGKTSREYFHHVTHKKGLSMALPPYQVFGCRRGQEWNIWGRWGAHFIMFPMWDEHRSLRLLVGSVGILFVHPVSSSKCVYHIDHVNWRLSIESPARVGQPLQRMDQLRVGWSGCNATIKIVWRDPISPNEFVIGRNTHFIVMPTWSKPWKHDFSPCKVMSPLKCQRLFSP